MVRFVCFLDSASGSVSNDMYSVNSVFMSAEVEHRVILDVPSKTQIGFEFFDQSALWIFLF